MVPVDPLQETMIERLAASLDPPREPWREVPARVWLDWRWQLRNTVHDLRDLERWGFIETGEGARLEAVVRRYPLRVSPYYLNLARAGGSDPILRQALPTTEEIDPVQSTLDPDPFAERDHSPLPGLIRRYADRVLLLTSSTCTTYCRHCFRKRLLGRPGEALTRDHLDEALDAIRRDPSIHEVILSGGDPLTLPPALLQRMLDELSRVDHLDAVRLGTRVPVTLPMRLFDHRLAEILGAVSRLWVLTQFNHPREITPVAAAAVELLRHRGIPVLNQAVLLRGVNDDVETLTALHRGLIRIGVKPYYLHHADPVRGTAHFRTSIASGVRIMTALQGRLSGLALPAYVVDLPRSEGKIRVPPPVTMEHFPDRTVFRGPGDLYDEYPNPVLPPDEPRKE